MSETIEIASGASRAQISLLGAELKSWRVGDDDLIWPGDSASWTESAPLLFPVVGWTRDGIRVEGQTYPLGLHGFARVQEFAVVDRRIDSVVLALRASAATRTLYPFEFELEVKYSIQDSGLQIELEVMNKDEGALPYAIGLHPGFAWPLPGARENEHHEILFDAAESGKIPVIAPGGLFSSETREITLEGRRLPLDPNLFTEALCFLDARSQGLEFRSGGRSLALKLENFPHIALWTLPGAKFLCLEAWTGYGDPVGFDADIFAKPSMRVLARGEKARHAATFSWRSS